MSAISNLRSTIARISMATVAISCLRSAIRSEMSDLVAVGDWSASVSMSCSAGVTVSVLVSMAEDAGEGLTVKDWIAHLNCSTAAVITAFRESISALRDRSSLA